MPVWRLMYKPSETTSNALFGSNVSIAMHCYDEGMIVDPNVIAQFWNVISNDRRTKTAFAKQGGKTLANLHAAMLRHNTRFLFIYNGNKPGALIWLTNVINGTADIHVLGMTSSYGRDMVKLCRIGIGYLFSLCSQINTLSYHTFIGKIAASNTLAVRLAIRCGMTIVGTIPSYTYDYKDNALHSAVLLYINNPQIAGGTNE